MIAALNVFRCVLGLLAELPPAQDIKLTDSSETLAKRLDRLVKACSEQMESLANKSLTDEFLTDEFLTDEFLTNEFLKKLKPHFTSLAESKADLDIWTAVANLLRTFNSPAVPETSSTRISRSTPPQNDGTDDHAVLLKLRDKWTSEYLPDSLDALRDAIRRYGKKLDDKAEKWQIYAKTLLFIQSTGMGKSRLADKFGETCPMINITLGQANFKCYPPIDYEVLSFLCGKLPKTTKDMILDLPRKKRLASQRDQKMTTERPSSNEAKESLPVPGEDKASQSPEEFYESLATTAWNHTRAAAFLQACFEVCKLRQLFII